MRWERRKEYEEVGVCKERRQPELLGTGEMEGDEVFDRFCGLFLLVNV